MILPNQKRPCADCPFRKDSLKGWLGEARMREILDASSFVCHKKTDLQCAGHMLIKGDENAFNQLAHRLNMPLTLKGGGLVFANKQELINHHAKY